MVGNFAAKYGGFVEYSQSSSNYGFRFLNLSMPLLGIISLALSLLVRHPMAWQVWLLRFIAFVLIIYSIQDSYSALRFCMNMRRPLIPYGVGEWLRLYWAFGYSRYGLHQYYVAANKEHLQALQAEQAELNKRHERLSREIERLNRIREVCFERLNRIGYERNDSTEKYFALIERLLDSNCSKQAMTLVRKIEATQRPSSALPKIAPQAPAVSLDCELNLRNARALLGRYERLPAVNRSPEMKSLSVDIERSLRENAVDDRAFRKTCHALERLLDAAGN
jgi:hypothetical protein